jgi:hypothetical protein
MSHPTDDLRVTLKLEEDDDNSTATFTLFLADVKLSEFVLLEPDMFKKQEWHDFIAQRRPKLEFCDSHGTVTMSWGDVHTVKCEVWNVGGGGSGTSTQYFPGTTMIGPMKELAAHFN